MPAGRGVDTRSLIRQGLLRQAGSVTWRAMTDSPKKKPSRQKAYTLVVQVGRSEGDGLPKGSSGAGLICFASGIDEAEAVRETVAILKQADLAPLDVTGYGTLDERLAEGHEISEDERALMQRALDENSVIVAEMTPFYGDQTIKDDQ